MIYKLSNDVDIVLIEVSNRSYWKGIPLIYVLVDPRDNIIKYVGKSINGIDRAFEHNKLSSLKLDGNTKKALWIKHLLSLNMKPSVFVVAQFNLPIDRKVINEYLYNKEQSIIDLLRTSGIDLKNSTDGGPGAINRQVSELTREKMSKSAKKRELPNALKLRNQAKYGPPIPKSYYYSRRNQKKRKGTLLSYQNSLKKKLIGKNLTTNTEITFNSINDCERYFKMIEETKKFNRKYLRYCIKNNKSYYGFIWSFV